MSKLKLVAIKPTPEQLREENRARFIAENQAEWTEAGAKYRKLRESLGLTIRRMSELTGYSSAKLGSFELGHPVGNRKSLRCAYSLVSKSVKHDEFKAFMAGWAA
jgi:tRNA nucleotidyltransferase (CCA-adding enzyme)